MNSDIFEKTTSFRHAKHTSGAGMFISIFDGENKPYKINLSDFNKETVTFGRGSDNDIVLLSGLVSRNHGYFKVSENRCMIFDNNSTNGLTINGMQVEAQQLGEGTQVRIDDYLDPTAKGVLILFSFSADEFMWQSFDISNKGTVTIGRDASCDICLPHVSVSKVHAKIVEEKDGSFFIYDNNSTNGISINGKTVARKARLREKDIVLITNSKIMISGRTINYCCFSDGIGVDALNIEKTVKVKGGKRNIANDITLAIKPCEFVAIVGGSGAGKTTFMNCISGYVKATKGQVVVNGEDLYTNYDVMKNMIGYVPQQDIVYDNLLLADMLDYTARLRMPKDTSAQERKARVQEVIDIVELTGREDTFIRQLSGGQKKRASIAVELLSDPNLFFLDEPSSGLDPGTERNLMKTLKNMTQKGKTIILVTHNTLNLHLCDKVIFLGNGGNLCFCGKPDDALRFFGVDNFVDIYNILTDDSEFWKNKYSSSEYISRPQFSFAAQNVTTMEDLPQDSKGTASHQIAVLCKRYAKLLINDRQRMLLLILQAPLLGLLISLVANGRQFDQYEMTKSILFAFSCAAFWVGILNSIQEVCKERVILKREYMTGLRLSSYIASKMIVLGCLCLLQTVLLVSVFWVTVVNAADSQALEEGVFLNSMVEIFITTFLTSFSAAAMGIFVSTLFKNADRAMTVAPILLMPQILFSNVVFNLEGATEKIAMFVNCRWAIQAYGTTANLNELPHRILEEYPMLSGSVKQADFYEDFFEYTTMHLVSSWLVLGLFIAAFASAGILVLKNVKKS